MPVRRLKIVLLGRSAEPVGAYWDGKKANKWKMIKLKHVQNGENVIVCGKPNSLCCEAGDVISKLSAYQTTKKLANMQCLCSNQNKMVGGKAGVIIKLCTGQATKNGSVDCSAEPSGAHWDEEMAKKMKHRNEPCSDIFKL